MGVSDFLFASPSFLTGAGRVLDLGGALEHYSYNFSRTPAEADARAIANDWAVVGRDLGQVMGRVKEKAKLGAR